MQQSLHIKRRFRQATIPAGLILVLAYFVYHAVQGEHGLLALRDLEVQYQALEGKAAKLQAKRAKIESKVALLRPDNLDPDMLDEQARRELGFVHPDDIVILRPERLIEGAN